MTIFLMLLAILTLLHAVLFVPFLRARHPRLRGGLVSLVLALDSCLAALLLLELYFAKIHDQSDGFNLTYAGRTWFARHWKPLNSLGYRDAEPARPAPGQKAVVFLGDSFTAGHGIANPADRFPDVAARILGPGYKVYNVAKIGWDTVDETRALREFPVKPDVVMLAYYPNDIFRAASEAGYPLTFAVNLPRGVMKDLVDHSALADFIYWRLARGGNLSGGAGSFWDALKGAYNDPGVWKLHAAEMAALVGYCRDNGITLVVVVFPMLQAPAESAPLTGKVAAEFASLGARVVDLTQDFAGRPARDMVVNALDAHPNSTVHRQVGERLALLLEQTAANAE